MATPTASTTPAAAIGPTHPLYATYAPIWRQLADVAEGKGGFRDGTYIVPHPREWKDHDAQSPTVPTKKLIERRALARDNGLGPYILKQKLDGLFRKAPTRRMVSGGKVVDAHPYLDWTNDVDGAGATMDQWLRQAYQPALIFGHVFAVVDRATDDGPTAADRAPIVLREYAPEDVPDWLRDRHRQLVAVKVVEAVERTSLADSPLTTGAAFTIREITPEASTAYRTDKADEKTTVAHKFGVLPVVPMYAERRPLTPVIGQSALGDPKQYIDLYNLTSEKRELERKQTFSMVNIPVGSGKDGGPAFTVQEVQDMVGSTNGTQNFLMTPSPAQVLTAETDNVRVYMEDEDKLTREICRSCAVAYDQDGREAETAESRRLKRADYNTCLLGYAGELQRAEMAIAQIWYRGTYGDQWEREWERARPEVSYPETFDEEPFAEVLDQATAAQSLPLAQSVTFRTEHSMRLAKTFLRDAPPETIEEIRAELEALPTPEQEREQRLEEMTAKVSARAGAFGKPAAPKESAA